jgi:uncharacterized Ntn-hydrolase superfamily protein
MSSPIIYFRKNYQTMKSKAHFFLFSTMVASLTANAQVFNLQNPLSHTYSIVAFDPATGEMGAAVQSHWFSVGTIVIWGEAGVGVVATQSFVNPAFGPSGLSLMQQGFGAEQTLKMLITGDEGRDFRQLALLDATGKSSSYTGSKCVESAGHIVGEGYAVQANLMLNDQIWPAMASAFEASKGQPLAERMVAALLAAEAAGGDIRGKQSAALLVVNAKSTGKPWIDRSIDLRVDDHPSPLEELSRLLTVHRAYQHMNAGDLAVEKNDFQLAMREYGAAENLQPQNEEMQYWHAIALVNLGRVEEALPIFRKVFQKNKNWAILTPRLLKNGLLTADEKTLSQILATQKQ